MLDNLQIYFLEAFERGDLPSTQQDPRATCPHHAFRSWLQRQYTSFLQSAMKLLISGDPHAQLAALSTVMQCIRGEKTGVFNSQLYCRLLDVVLQRKGVCSQVLAVLIAKYTGLADVRYFTLLYICSLASKYSKHSVNDVNECPLSDTEQLSGCDEEGGSLCQHDVVRNLLDVISHVSLNALNSEGSFCSSSWCGALEAGIVVAADHADGSRQRRKRKLKDNGHEQVPASHGAASKEAQRAKWANPKLQKKLLSTTWMSFLRLDLPEDVYKKVLVHLHDLVIPACFNPLLLSDFLTHSLDKGGLIGMLALNGIFLLVTEFGLEYPKFYQKLYGLVCIEAFQAKYRLRFFQLADAFLASNMVPAYTAASFIKRFARLALCIQPGGALVALVFIHNILRRHPACMQMLHRPSIKSSDGNAISTTTLAQAPVDQGQDVFNDGEADPLKSRAIESSLWEMEALKNHSSPMVAQFCEHLYRDLSNRRSTAEINIEEFLAKSYHSMFTMEVERRMKSVSSAFYAAAPSTTFDRNCMLDYPLWST